MMFRLNLVHIVLTMILFATLTSCTAADTSEQTENEYDNQMNSRENKQIINEPGEQPEFTLDNFEGYMKYVKSVQYFEPYYQLVFKYEALPEGISSVPVEKVLAMYEELKATFDFITVTPKNPLIHVGTYTGDVEFVHGYDLYQSIYAASGRPSPINYVGKDRKGNEMITTPLKTVILCENSIGRFDSCIAEGRNLARSDFKLSSRKDPIPVVLGGAYKDVYKIGDRFSLTYLHVPMNFEVVGFYREGLGFSMAAGANEKVDIDHSIILPYFLPAYEADGEDETFQHRVHIAELTSGYIAISEPIEEIKENTYKDYISTVEEIAKRHDLSGVYLSPVLPVGFLFPKS